MSITEKRIQSSQETALRTMMDAEMAKMGEEKTISEIIKAIIDGEMAHRLGSVCKVIVPIKRVEIRKTEVLEMGAAQDQPVFVVEVPAEPEAVVEAPAEEAPEAPAEAEQ